MNAILIEDVLAAIPPATVAFAEMSELRRDLHAGLLTEGVDYDVVTVDEETARSCFKPGSFE